MGNNIFFVYDVDEKHGYNIACENKEKALEIFEDNNLLDCKNFSLELDVRLQKEHYPNGEWNEEGEVYKTDYYGVLDVKQEFEVGIVWFNCPECGDDSFEFNENLSRYTCKVCGYEDDVPYV